MAQRQMHREVFLAHNGPGPYKCFGCHESILFAEKFSVHHVDWDDSNNDPANLVAVHQSCHSRIHRVGFRHTDEAKTKISLAGRGVKRSAKHREAVANASRNRVWTEEMRRKLSAARRGVPHSEAHIANLTKANKRRAASPLERERLREIGKLGAAIRWGEILPSEGGH